MLKAHRFVVAACLAILVVALGPPGLAVQVKQISSVPAQGLALAPDGTIWATFPFGRIYRIDPTTNAEQHYEVTHPANTMLTDLEVDGVGNIWFGMWNQTSNMPGLLGRLTPAGAVSLYQVTEPRSTGGTATSYLARTTSGSVYFSVRQPAGLGYVPPGGAPAFNIELTNTPIDVLVSRDGAIWYSTEPRQQPPFGSGGFGRIRPGGMREEFFAEPDASTGTLSHPYLIGEAPDGSIWATDSQRAVFHRVMQTGDVVTYPIPNYSRPPGCPGLYVGSFRGITAGRDGNMWAVGCGQVARITPDGEITTFSYPGIDGFIARTATDGNILFSGYGVYRLDPLGVEPPELTVTPSPASIGVPQTGSGSVQIRTKTGGSFDGPVSLSVLDLPEGVDATLSPVEIPAPGSGTSTLTIDVGFSALPGTYSVTVRAVGGGLTRSVPLQLEVPAPKTLSRLVPIVLDVTSGSAHYTTELALTNATALPLAVSLRYAPALGSRSGGGVVTTELAAGEQRVVPNALTYLREGGLAIPSPSVEPSQGGALVVTFSGPSVGDPRLVSVTARTTSPTMPPLPEGTAGLAYSGLAVTGSSAPAATIFGLRSTEKDRSNVAVFNLSDQPVTFRVTVYSGRGDGKSVLYKAAEHLEAWGWYQYSSASLLDATGIDNGWVTVHQTSATGAIGVYGVLNDNVTNDGSFVLPPASGAASTLTVPVVVETPDFRSELVLSNKGQTAATLTLNYAESLAAGGPSGGAISLTLLPAEQLVIPGAIDFLRRNGVPIGGEGAASYAGALRVSVTGGNVADVFAGARTAAPLSGGGEFGLFTPCVYGGREATDEAYLYGLQANATNRTNVAVLNAGSTGDGPVDLELQVFDGTKDGAAAGTPTPVSLAPGRWVQVSGLLKTKGVENGWVRVRKISGAAPWIAYAVVNDGGMPGERTGDGAYVPMTTLDSVCGDGSVACAGYSRAR